MTKVGKFIVEGTEALITRLCELDTAAAIKSLPEGGLKFFCELLCSEMFGSLNKLSSSPVFSPTGIAGDNTLVCHIVWSDEIIASTLATTRDNFDTSLIHCSPRHQS